MDDYYYGSMKGSKKGSMKGGGHYKADYYHMPVEPPTQHYYPAPHYMPVEPPTMDHYCEFVLFSLEKLNVLLNKSF